MKKATKNSQIPPRREQREISFLTQEEPNRLFAVIISKRDRA